mmetsp:Transcript_7197/g.10513  ORF Transcript_7197/g.10513 Transcript_7197/m.10513 type:complete len:542 (-) Transcript_7197:107-1732(-)
MPSSIIPKETSSLIQPQRESSRSEGEETFCRLSLVSACLLLVGIVITHLNFLPETSSSSVLLQSGPLAHEADYVESFPDDFIFGSATSSYQVEGATREGGRGLTIWDNFCYQGGHVLKNTSGDVACDHYHRYENDVKLMKDLNLKAYRFSIAWSRILPNGYGGGKPNAAGIDFYNGLIDTLIENGIEPWITLFHWDLPQQLEEDVNGWLDNSKNYTVVEAFGDYARICFKVFGDRVKHWITLNEPWTVSVHGYNDGIKAPGRRSNGAYETYLAAHNQLLAHAKAARIYKEDFAPMQKGIIGMSNSADYRYPFSDSQEDIEAAERAMLFQFGWFVEPVITGDYPKVMRQRVGDRLPKFTEEQSRQLKGSCDFLGINTYSSALASAPSKESPWGGYWADMFVTTHNDPTWEFNFMGWAIVPDATRELLLWISKRYGNPLLYITENGSAEDENDVIKAQHDESRRSFFEGHIRACKEAISQGVRLAGYFAWSLMDNFEWEYGYERRFGICFVDFKTQVRTPKSSAIWYSETIATQGRNIVAKKQ